MFPFNESFGNKLVPCFAGIPTGFRLRVKKQRYDEISWQGMVCYKMSEIRGNIDAQHSFFPSGRRSPEPVSQTVRVSLAEAIGKAAAGEIDPQQVIPQLPGQLRSILDSFAQAHFKKELTALSSVEQREILKILADLMMKNVGAGQLSSIKGNASTPRRSEMRADSSQSYFPSSSRQSAYTPQLWLTITLGVIVVLTVAAFFIWRWLT